MSACANAAISRASSRSYRADMRSGLCSAMADPRATTRDRANVCASAHAMRADMRTDAYAQHINTAADILGAGRASGHDTCCENKNEKGFHGVLRGGVSRCQEVTDPDELGSLYN
jgi:hypothetical protein